MISFAIKLCLRSSEYMYLYPCHKVSCLFCRETDRKTKFNLPTLEERLSVRTARLFRAAHLFSLLFVLRLSNVTANILLHIRQFVRQEFHILTYLLIGDFCVYLRGLYIGVSQQAADRFNRYTIG